MAVIETRMKEGSIETLHDLSVSEVNYFIRNGVHTVDELRERLPEFEKKAPKMYQSARNALIKVNRREEIVIESDDYKRALSVTKNIKVNAEIMEQSLYEVCKGLAEVKGDKLYKPMGYSSFENYCEVEIGIKKVQAYKYVSIGENLSSDFVHSSEQIGVTKMALLAQLDEPTRQEITQNTDLESTSVKELKAKIKELEDNAKSDNELIESLTKSKTEMRCARNLAENKAKELEYQAKELKERAETAEFKLKNVRDTHEHLKEVEERKHAERVKELEKQVRELRENPVQVTVEDTTKIQELEEQLRQIQEKYQSELETVRKELSENRSQSLATFNAYLTSATNAMERLCDFVSVRMADENINHYKQKIELLLRCVSSKINLGGD